MSDTVCSVCGNSGSTPDFLVNHTCHTLMDSPAQTEDPVIVVSDGGPITFTPTSHGTLIGRIAVWRAALERDRTLGHAVRQDRLVMADATVALLETDAATGISIEAFGPVADLVSRTVAHAMNLPLDRTTVHFPVH